MRLSLPKFIFPFLTLVAGLIILQACGDDTNYYSIEYENVPPPYNINTAVSDSTTENGLKFYVIEKGTGSFDVISRDQVYAYFTGRTKNGRVLQSSYTNRDSVSIFDLRTFPATVQIVPGLQRGTPILDALRQGIIGMVKDEKRKIVIPPSLGYGDAVEGSNNYDLRNDTLYYDVQVLSIQ